MSNELFKAVMAAVIGGIILLYFQYQFFESGQKQPSDNKIEIEVIQNQNLRQQNRIEAETQANTKEERRRREPKVEQLILSIDRTMKVDRGYNTLNHHRIIKEIIVIDTQTRHIEKEIQQLKKISCGISLPNWTLWRGEVIS
ncbi:hypothetical protein BGP_3619 [Beggiatoa sp. PS]|nr:hypothetical protein BGP_3619 [Beggiatoa sp. PS]